MIGNTTRGNVCTTVFIFIGIMLLAVGAAYSSDSSGKSVKPAPMQPEVKTDSGEWKRGLEAAKKEGRIVISGDPTEAWRTALTIPFMQEYPEITVEYTGLNGRNFWPRIRQERAMGQNLWDLGVRGLEVQAYAAKKDNYLDPVRPLLLPEIADNSKWLGGLESIFYDWEKKYFPAFTIYIQRPVAVNRDFIKESEIKSSAQLLDPKFKGKIVIQTPTGGSSYSALVNLGYMYGENFLRELLSKQNLIVTDDNRQQAEWVVRGKYPIAIGFEGWQLIPFQKQGLGRNVVKLDDTITPVATGLGCIALLKDAPHPNAARVYINWLLSQKTQMQLSKNVLLNSRRTDVPPVVKELAVDPAHMNNYYYYTREENLENSMRFLPLLKETLKY